MYWPKILKNKDKDTFTSDFKLFLLIYAIFKLNCLSQNKRDILDYDRLCLRA